MRLALLDSTYGLNEGGLAEESAHLVDQIGDGTALVQVIGILVAAISGYVAIKLLLKLVSKYDCHPFVVYLWIIGLVCIAS